MDAFSKIADQRIREAIERGEFLDLEHAGTPLDLDDDAWVPEDLRMSYRMLRNAGCIPPELELRNEIMGLRDLISALDDDQQRLRKIRELNFRLMKLNEMRKRPLTLDDLPEYEEKIYRKIAG